MTIEFIKSFTRTFSKMAKSVSEKKVRNHIPNDLTFYILLKLSLKSLKRFGCVCKTWAFLFENPHFRSNFISIPHSYDTSILLYEVEESNDYSRSFYLLFGVRHENRVKLDFPNQLQRTTLSLIFMVVILLPELFSLHKETHLYSRIQLPMNSRPFLPAPLSLYHLIRRFRLVCMGLVMTILKRTLRLLGTYNSLQ